jgi:Tol biopolymer transport system component
MVAIAPNGKDVATVCGDPDMNVCILHADGTITRVTDQPISSEPVWGPGTGAITFSIHQRGRRDAIAMKPINGAAPQQVLLEGDSMAGVDDWAANGRELLYKRLTATRDTQFYVFDLITRVSKPYLRPQHMSENHGRFSPDGKWVAYQCEHDREIDVCVSSYPEPELTYRVSSGGGTAPRWQGDGRTLFYLRADGTLFKVAVEKDGTELKFGKPDRLFQLPVLPPPLSPLQFDVDRSGTRIALVRPSTPAHSEFVVMTRPGQ